MRNYLVRWEIELDAETPLEAARIAREAQLDTHSLATVFDVFVQDENLPTKYGESTADFRIDLRKNPRE